MEQNDFELLNSPEIQRYVQLVTNLGHFNYAMARLQLIPTLEPDLRPPHGFYSEEVLRKLGDWFGKPGGHESLMDAAVLAVGLPIELLGPINRILDSPIGSIDWRRFVKDYRNRVSSHEAFTEMIQSQVADMHGVSMDLLQSSLVRFIDDVAPAMKLLQIRVEEAFELRSPRIYAGIRDGRYFFSARSHLPGE